jgi:parallel beta-helix repeat protein
MQNRFFSKNSTEAGLGNTLLLLWQLKQNMHKFAAITMLLLLVLCTSITAMVLPAASQFPSNWVYIREDGSVQGTNNIQHNGDYYTFSGDVTGPLVVERNNIIVDGAGHTLTGGNYSGGIVLENRTGVTIKNTRITLDDGTFITLNRAVNCSIEGNTLVGTPKPRYDLSPPTRLFGPTGISFLFSKNITVKDNRILNFSSALDLEWSSGHIITGNTFTDGMTGIDFWNSTNCFFRNNRLTNCDFSFRAYPLYQFDNDLDASNTIDGHPTIYWVNKKDMAVPSDAGYVVLLKCRNITVENICPKSLNVLSSTNCTIQNVKMIGSREGINVLDSSNINILRSLVSGQAIGISLDGCLNSLIKGNHISDHHTRGLIYGNSTNTNVVGNIFTNNTCAITPTIDMDPPSKNTLITSNNFTGNNNALDVESNEEINGNLFENNTQAVFFYEGTANTFTQNTLVNNKVALSFSSSSGNDIFLNNFLQNNEQIHDYGANVQQSHSEVNYIPPPPPSTNNWDNDGKGNYWIDYQGSDGNADGIGDSSYFLYINNQDHFPLMNQVPAPELTDFSADFFAALPKINEPTLTPLTTATGPSENNTDIPIGYIVLVVGVTIGLLTAVTVATRNRKKKQANPVQP